MKTAEELLNEWINPFDIGAIDREFIIAIMKEYAQQQVKNLNIPSIITPFWFWLVREANIKVINAENAIEVRGFLKDGDMLVPVMSFAELLELYKSQNGL